MIWLPYCGSAPTPDELLGRWNFDPALVLVFFGATTLAALWRRRRGIRYRLLLGALAVLAVSFISPLCALSSALFSARTVHHILLMAVAAPLLAWSIPLISKRRRFLGLATITQAVILWMWHVPTLYEAALMRDTFYWLMQLSLLASAFFFWQKIRSSSTPAAIGALLFTTMQMGLLGALLTFAQTPLYAPHILSTLAWGLSPIADQRLAGLLMWAPASGLYLLAGLMLLYRALEPAHRPA